MDPLRIALRCVIAFGYLLATTRLSGKRTVAQATAFDFVVALVLGDLIDDAIWAEVPASAFFVASGTIIFADLSVKMFAHHSDRFLRVAMGRPRVLVKDGEPVSTELKRELMTADDLEHLMRQKGVERSSWPDVKAGILEKSGELSAIKKAPEQDAQKRDRDLLKDESRGA